MYVPVSGNGPLAAKPVAVNAIAITALLRLFIRNISH